MVTEIQACGGGSAELNALAFSRPGGDRERLHAFLLHYLKHGHTVINRFEVLTCEIVQQGCPESVGCETLSGSARKRWPHFPCYNNVRPGYVVALRIKRPDFAAVLDHGAPWPLALLKSGWNPWADSESDE